jgi:hypothetical protein
MSLFFQMTNAQFEGSAGAKMPHFYSNPAKQGISLVNDKKPQGKFPDSCQTPFT